MYLITQNCFKAGRNLSGKQSTLQISHLGLHLKKKKQKQNIHRQVQAYIWRSQGKKQKDKEDQTKYFILEKMEAIQGRENKQKNLIRLLKYMWNDTNCTNKIRTVVYEGNYKNKNL